jgi:hypothetical protein
MGPPDPYQHVVPAHWARADPAGVAGDGGGRKPDELGDGEVHRVRPWAQLLRSWKPSRSQHDGNVVPVTTRAGG